MVELASPIRLYWDLAGDQPAGERLAAICGEIAALRFLSIHLKDCGSILSPGVRQAVTLLSGPGRAVMLSAPPTLLDRGEPLPEGLRLLVLNVLDRQELQVAAAIRNRLTPQAVAVGFPVPSVSLQLLPQLLAAALEAGFREIHLPMQRLTAFEPCWTPTIDELKKLSLQLRQQRLPDNIQLTIHDPFLWKAFHPELPFPDGGCQAANTMLFIAPDTTVYPCPLVPVPLGSLNETTLRDIVRGADKKNIRSLIRQQPEICSDCPELSGCNAGCRGRAFVTGGWQLHDPACGR